MPLTVDDMTQMNFEGIIVGLATFLIIGIFHPIVIKAEYHFGTRCWWAFLLAGCGFAALSLFLNRFLLLLVNTGTVPAEKASRERMVS